MLETNTATARLYWDNWLSNRKKLFYLYSVWTKGDTVLSEDLLSETLLHALKKYLDQADSIKNFDYWIKTVALNIFLQYKRRDKRHQEIINQSVSLQEPGNNIHQIDPRNIVYRDDFRNRVSGLIPQLPPGLRIVVNLFMQGMSYREISEHLSISETNVRKRIQLAKTRLCDLVGDEIN